MRRFGLLLLLLGLLWAPRVRAADLYAVDVFVDVTDVNASVAREKAMAEANRQAFEKVLRKIIAAENVSEVMQLNDYQILNFVQEVSVVSEKSSNVRYIAELRVKLNQEILNQYIKEKGIPFLIDKGANVLIVPVYRESPAAKPLLWEEGNLWRLCWEKNQGSKGIVDFESLMATDANKEVIDAAKALSLDARLLGWLARQNRVGSLFVVEAINNGTDLNINIYSPLGEGQVLETLAVSLSYGDEAFSLGVEKVKERLSARIKQQNTNASQAQQEVTVLFMYKSVREWLELQKQLQDLSMIKNVQEEAIGDGKTQFRMTFSGSLENLNKALSGKLFNLKDYGNFYLIESIY